MQASILGASVIVNPSELKVYKRLDEETVATVSGDTVCIWNIESDEAIQLSCVSSGKSGMTVDQIINNLWS